MKQRQPPPPNLLISSMPSLLLRSLVRRGVTHTSALARSRLVLELIRRFGAGDVQVVEPSIAIKIVPTKWKKLKINLEDLARLRWLRGMTIPEICNTLGRSRSTVQISIRTIRKLGISQMNFSKAEEKIIEKGIYDEILKFADTNQESGL